MDSLFDASLFDAVPAPAPVKAGAPVGAGQLDIFGNEVVEPVEAIDPVGTVDAAAAAATAGEPADREGEDAAAAQAGAMGEPGSSPAADVPATDPLEAAELVGVEVTPIDDPDHDPGDELNDPSWEPPIDDAVLDDPVLSDPVLAEPAVAETVLSEPALVEPVLPETVLEDAPAERGPSADVLWASVIGQPRAVAALRSAALAPVHAYLLVGPPGSGRLAAARAFAASVVCPRGGCGACDVCRRAMASVHPDVIVVEREGASISVDQAREIIRLAMRSPVEGTFKVLVLVDFHLVTNAAPTLLKIIEEPPPSTVFVVLADQVTNELVTIASRCVQVDFVPLSRRAVVEALVAGGAEPSKAERATRAAAGRLDRARLLVDDEQLGERLEFWESVGRRVDGTGAAASALAAEAVLRVESAAVGPLEARHAAELAALDARLEATGGRGGAGQKKELGERHRRELKRLRDDELRFGLAVLEQHYHDRLVDAATGAGPLVAALEAIRELNADLVRNPAIGLALTALFLRLPGAERPERELASARSRRG